MRINISLPENLVRNIDRYAKKHHLTRSGFLARAVHDYQSPQLPITVRIITRHLDEFLDYPAKILKKDGAL